MSIALKPNPLVWTASGGSINSSTGVWQAPAVTDAETPVKITASNGVFSVTIDVFVLPIFPLNDPILPVSWRRKREALISMSEDRSSRIVRYKSDPYDDYEVKFAARLLSESNAVDDFWDEQGYDRPFILEDTVRGVRKVGWFDSEIQHEGAEECAQDLSFRFTEWIP